MMGTSADGTGRLRTVPGTGPRLVPRSAPRQARAAETRAAICEAAIQLLLKDGLTGLTTVRISKRAGVSVGTYYQYFPNKEALLVSLVDQHLSRVTLLLQAACKESHGRLLGAMVSAFIHAYVTAQLAEWNSARVIYRFGLLMGAGPVLARERALVVAAVAKMLGTDARFAADDLELIALTFFGAVSGAARAWLENSPDPLTARGWESHLERLALPYLESFGPAGE